MKRIKIFFWLFLMVIAFSLGEIEAATKITTLEITSKEVFTSTEIDEYFQLVPGSIIYGYDVGANKYYSIDFSGNKSEVSNPYQIGDFYYDIELEEITGTGTYTPIIKKVYKSGTLPSSNTKLNLTVLDSIPVYSADAYRLRLSNHTDDDKHYVYVKEDGEVIIADTSKIIDFRGNYGVSEKTASGYEIYNLNGQVVSTITNDTLKTLFEATESDPTFVLNILGTLGSDIVLSAKYTDGSNVSVYIINEKGQKVVNDKFQYTTDTQFYGEEVFLGNNIGLVITKINNTGSSLLVISNTKRIVSNDEYTELIGDTNGTLIVKYVKNGMNYLKVIDHNNKTLLDNIVADQAEVIGTTVKEMENTFLVEGKVALKVEYVEHGNPQEKINVITYEDCSDEEVVNADTFDAIHIYFVVFIIFAVGIIVLSKVHVVNVKK